MIRRWKKFYNRSNPWSLPHSLSVLLHLADGFSYESQYDRPSQGGNGDGVIDSRDSVFPLLRLWRDGNHNGISEQGELHALPTLNVVRLHLDYKESKRIDESGNHFKYRAKIDDAKGTKAGRWAWDVFLQKAP